MDARKICRVVFNGCLLMATWAIATGSANAQSITSTDWPQWRGVNRDNISTESGLLQQWPKGGPEKLWTFEDAGMGYAGFSVVQDRLYTLGANDENEFAICLDANDGSEIWRTIIGSRFKNRWGDGPRNTPTVDNDMLFVLSASGLLKCLNLEDGSAVWGVSLTEDFGGTKPYWGFAESPLVDGDQVICTPGGNSGSLIALNKNTGDTIWQSRLFTDKAHYSSIVTAEAGGKRQYVQLFEKSLAGFDAADGELLWTHEWRGSTAVIPTPIVHDSTVYVTSGYGAGSMLVNISDPERAEQIWFSNKMKNHHGGVILLNGNFFGYSDKVGWVCQSEETGDVVWREKEELGKGAIAYADGRFYLLEEKSGTVVLIDASDEGWQEHGRFKLEPLSPNRKPKGAVWVHPVISNGKLFLRDQEFISCYDISDSK